MARQSTRWRPDTCGCVVEYSWDDALPAAQQEAGFQLLAIAKCAAHTALPDAQAYAAVREENPRKNRALQHLVERFPGSVARKARQPDGSDIDEPDPDKVTFSYDADRVLRIRVTGANGPSKAALRNALAAHLGAGKAEVD